MPCMQIYSRNVFSSDFFFLVHELHYKLIHHNSKVVNVAKRMKLCYSTVYSRIPALTALDGMGVN